MIDVDLYNIIPTPAGNLDIQGIEKVKKVQLENKNLKTILIVLGISLTLTFIYVLNMNNQKVKDSSET